MATIAPISEVVFYRESTFGPAIRHAGDTLHQARSVVSAHEGHGPLLVVRFDRWVEVIPVRLREYPDAQRNERRDGFNLSYSCDLEPTGRTWPVSLTRLGAVIDGVEYRREFAAWPLEQPLFATEEDAEEYSRRRAAAV